MSDLNPETVRALSCISEEHRRFVEYASRDARCLDAGAFRSLGEAHCCAASDPVQAWPTLLGARTRATLDEVATGLARLVRQLPSLVFDDEADAISAYYHLQPDFVRHFVMPATTGAVLGGAIGRADLVMTDDGVWCVELNMAANVGGIWESPAWHERMTAVPVIASYLRDRGISPVACNSLRLMMRHVRQHAMRHADCAGGRVNVAYILQKESLVDDDSMRELQTYFAGEYAAVCGEEAPGTGEFLLCGAEDLDARGGTIGLRARAIQAVVEFTAGDVPLHVLRCHQHGGFTLHNGPATYILCNKLSLALLSELEDSGLFGEAAEALIKKHVPWTRKVVASEATFEGTNVFLPEFIRHGRMELVLKKGISRSGHDVVVGPATPPEEWEHALAHALYEQDWIVQSYLPCRALPYQHGDFGWCPHRGVWGVFVFGETYGGSFLRLLPETRGAVVATSKGAVDGIVLEFAECGAAEMNHSCLSLMSEER